MGVMEHPPITDKSPKTYVIVGTKRSGTSFLAQVLGENGVDIATCGNGHNEDLDFVQFSEKILKEAGGDWNDLPPAQEIAKAVHRNSTELIALLKSKKTMAWGWKDPRVGAMIEYFLPYLEDDVYLVCVFRKPAIAAASMHRTWPKHSLEFCLKVITDYQHRSLDAIEEFTK